MSESTKQLIQQFYSFQEKRVKTYSTFEHAFQDLISGTPGDQEHFLAYRQVAHDVTLAFQEVNETVLKVIEQLRGHDGTKEVTKLLEKLQNLEEQKLELTAQYQVSVEEARKSSSAEKQHNIQQTLERRQQVLQDIVAIMDELKYETEDFLQEEEVQEVDMDNN